MVLLAILLAASCSDSSSDEPKDEPVDDVSVTIRNFPIIDGSDSTTPLRMILACKLLGIDYHWARMPLSGAGDDAKLIIANFASLSEKNYNTLRPKLKENNTHQSFVNLMNGDVELIITARSISRDEQVLAKQKGVTLLEKPIARDAFIFMVNPANKVQSLTIEQIQKIYLGEITNWKQVGGEDAKIHPYVRNKNSGSQEKFETMVMAGLRIPDYPELTVGQAMMSPYDQLKYDRYGIGFTPYYYYAVMVDTCTTRAIGVNGIMPCRETIVDRTYPYLTEVYAQVRSDVSHKSKAWQLYEFLTTVKGQGIVKESGYVTLGE